MPRKSTISVGEIYGIYRVIEKAPSRRTQSGQLKSYYLCECINCGYQKEINAYKLTHRKNIYCSICTPPKYEVESFIGKRFGMLTVLEQAESKRRPNGVPVVTWLCKCDCGNYTEVPSYSLKTGHCRSCGCYHRKVFSDRRKKNLLGNRYGKLLVVSFSHMEKGQQMWKCLCDCGNWCITSTQRLNQGKKNSCGCLISTNEFEFMEYLKSAGYNYRHQYTFEDCRNCGKLPFDFALLDKDDNVIMLVELQGQQHYYPFTFCGEDAEQKKRNLEERQFLDNIKRAYCREHGYPLLEIRYTQFKRKIDVFEKAYNALLIGDL